MTKYKEGVAAQLDGKGVADNPYEPGSEAAYAWMDGYLDSEQDVYDSECDCSLCRPDLYDENFEELP